MWLRLDGKMIRRMIGTILIIIIISSEETWRKGQRRRALTQEKIRNKVNLIFIIILICIKRPSGLVQLKVALIKKIKKYIMHSNGEAWQKGQKRNASMHWTGSKQKAHIPSGPSLVLSKEENTIPKRNQTWERRSILKKECHTFFSAN